MVVRVVPRNKLPMLTLKGEVSAARRYDFLSEGVLIFGNSLNKISEDLRKGSPFSVSR